MCVPVCLCLCQCVYICFLCFLFVDFFLNSDLFAFLVEERERERLREVMEVVVEGNEDLEGVKERVHCDRNTLYEKIFS